MTIGGGNITVAYGFPTPRVCLPAPAWAWDSVEVDESIKTEPILPTSLNANGTASRRSLPSQVTDQKPRNGRIAALSVRARPCCSGTVGRMSHGKS